MDDRPLILFCHATGFCGSVWGPMASSLLLDYRCLAVDFRAHGDTRLSPGAEFSWAAMAEDVLVVLDHFDASPSAFAVGHSMGGAVALLAALARPEAFAAAWLFEPVVVTPTLTEPAGERLAASARRRKARFESREELRERYASRRFFAGWDRLALDAYVTHGFAEAPDGAVTLKCSPEDEARAFLASQQANIHPRLGGVQIPVAVGVGHEALSEPPVFPASVAAEVAGSIPSGTLRRFDDLGHLAPLEQPRRIADDVSSWFAETFR